MDLPTETLEQQKYYLKVIKKIIKEKRRNQDFKYIIRYIRRRERESLRKLHIKNNEGQIIETYTSRTDIEQAIIAYNINYFQQAHNTRVY